MDLGCTLQDARRLNAREYQSRSVAHLRATQGRTTQGRTLQGRTTHSGERYMEEAEEERRGARTRGGRGKLCTEGVAERGGGSKESRKHSRRCQARSTAGERRREVPGSGPPSERVSGPCPSRSSGSSGSGRSSGSSGSVAQTYRRPGDVHCLEHVLAVCRRGIIYCRRARTP